MVMLWLRKPQQGRDMLLNSHMSVYGTCRSQVRLFEFCPAPPLWAPPNRGRIKTLRVWSTVTGASTQQIQLLQECNDHRPSRFWSLLAPPLSKTTSSSKHPYPSHQSKSPHIRSLSRSRSPRLPPSSAPTTQRPGHRTFSKILVDDH